MSRKDAKQSCTLGLACQIHLSSIDSRLHPNAFSIIILAQKDNTVANFYDFRIQYKVGCFVQSLSLSHPNCFTRGRRSRNRADSIPK